MLGCAARTDATARPKSSPEAAPRESAHHEAGPAMHQHHDAMPHRFEDAEAWAEHFESPERLQWQKPDDVVARLELPRDAVVADVGAGTGYFAVRFARAVPDGKVFASDIEPDMVRYLSDRAQREGLANLVAVQGTAADPRLPEPVDVVFVCNVYHHIDDRPAFFGRIADALAPGGRLVLVDFKKDAPPDTPGPPPEHRIAQAQMVDELATVGWSLSSADSELLPYQYIAVFVRKRE
jgi:SAM-dependent methyltransferase